MLQATLALRSAGERFFQNGEYEDDNPGENSIFVCLNLSCSTIVWLLLLSAAWGHGYEQWSRCGNEGGLNKPPVTRFKIRGSDTPCFDVLLHAARWLTICITGNELKFASSFFLYSCADDDLRRYQGRKDGLATPFLSIKLQAINISWPEAAVGTNTGLLSCCSAVNNLLAPLCRCLA
jgi:hypothetical protein